MKFNSLALLLLCLASYQINAQNHYYERDLNVVVEENSITLKDPWVGGMNSMQFSDIDLNQDGIKDLFCYDRTSQKVITYINNGTANQVDYIYAPEYENKFPKISDWGLLVDYNCDGKEDIFASAPGGIQVYKNISDLSNGIQFTYVPNPFGVIHSLQLGNFTNIYVNSLDIPAIIDVDNDGDKDILTFGQFGGRMEYHKNLSVELYGSCDSLKFEMYNQCWGHFQEDFSNNTVTLHDTCSTTISNPELKPGDIQLGNERHSGSTVLALDMTGDGVKELILGDVSFTNFVGLYNGGTVVNSNSDMVSQDVTFPSYDLPVDLWLFPAGFYEDVNNDGVRDFLVSPNSYTQSEDKKSVMYYNNILNDSITDFSFVQDDFLQGDMLDFGTGSKPVLFDYDNDGLKDLFVSNLGYYDRTTNDYIPYIAQYQNIGTSTTPAFRLITDDYEGISTMGFDGDLHPSFGDLDGDGDQDMMIGDVNGQLHYFENIAGVGNTADFVLNTPYYQDNTATLIDVGNSAAPVLVDIDRDGDLDLLIGRKQGRINYFDNVGTPTTPAFEEIDDFFGAIDVKTIFDPGGYAVPAIYDYNGEYELLVGSNSGTIWRYDSIDNHLFDDFNLIDSFIYDIKPGYRSTPFLGELTGDTIPELIVGNLRGGLWFFDGDDSTVNIGYENHDELEFQVYPIPSKDQLHIRFESTPKYASSFVLRDIEGRILLNGDFKNQSNSINIADLANGVYFLQVRFEDKYAIKKIIKQ